MLLLFTERQIKDVPPTIWILCLTSLYILSQAFDLFLFHLLIDVHLAVVAMATMSLSLATLVRRYAFEYLRALKSLLMILAALSIYSTFRKILCSLERMQAFFSF